MDGVLGAQAVIGRIGIGDELRIHRLEVHVGHGLPAEGLRETLVRIERVAAQRALGARDRRTHGWRRPGRAPGRAPRVPYSSAASPAVIASAAACAPGPP